MREIPSSISSIILKRWSEANDKKSALALFTATFVYYHILISNLLLSGNGNVPHYRNFCD